MSQVMSYYDDLCTPAKIYIVLSIISIFFGILGKLPFGMVLFKLFFVFIWTWVLNYLCAKGFETVSWIIVLLPFIVMASAFVFVVSFGSKMRKK